MSFQTDIMSSDDEWEETLPMTTAPRVRTHTWDTLDTVEYQNKGHKYYNDLGDDIKLHNFGVNDSGRLVIHRCEPLKDPSTGLKKYPTVVLPSSFDGYDKVLLTMSLFHPNCGHVYVRFPNLKDKVEQRRTKTGLWANPSNGPFRLKKKAIDKGTKDDVAFQLGVNFKFHVPGMEPCFVIVATPFENGRLVTNKAVRSKSFRVQSKRQHGQTNSRKRRKKSKEINKLNTDIQAAQREKEILQREDTRMSYVNTEHQRFMHNLRNKISSIPPGPAKIALLHASRSIKKETTVVL
jgi:hypothetical protein